MTDTKENKESGTHGSWLSELIKALPAQLLTLILIPITIYLTLYFTEINKVAEPILADDVSISSYSSITGSPSENIRNSIKNDNRLYNNILIQLDGITPSPTSSKNWLNNNGDWDEDCQDIYQNIALKLKTDISQTLTDDLLLSRLSNNMIDEGKKALQIIDTFLNEINRINNLPKTPKGYVMITLGVLNKTSYDGLIYPEVNLSFSNKSFTLTSDSGFVQLKPHSFQSFSFTTFDISDDNKRLYKPTNNGTIYFTDSSNEGNRQAIIMKEFAQLIKNKKEIPVKITITVDGKKLPIKETIIHYSD